MQYVNNDMDDLFRKAGEEYPLQTGTPNWSKVAAAMAAAGPPVPADKPAPARRYWRWTILLLLLPLGWVCNHYWQVADKGHAPEEFPTKVLGNKPVHGKANRYPGTTKGASSQPGSGQDALQVVATPIYRAPVSGQQATPAPAQKKRRVQLAFKTTTPQISPVDSGRASVGSEDRQPPLSAASISTLAVAVAPLPTTLQPSASFDSTHAALSSSTAPAPIKKKQKGKALYAGLWAGSDLTTVHGQRTSNPGWQGGLLVGYRFQKRWSIESGLSLTRKHYYSKGDYYVSPYPVSPNIKLTEVEGSCTMLEIPVNIRYNIVQQQRAAWFATAGLSSYIMKREDYDLTYHYLNSGNYGVHSYSYRNASRNLFSVLHLSTGYQHQVNRGLSLRLEPALRLPLTGLGYGRLRFSSMALQVGVTKDL